MAAALNQSTDKNLWLFKGHKLILPRTVLASGAIKAGINFPDRVSTSYLGVENNPSLFYFISLCDWCKNYAAPSQPIRYVTNTTEVKIIWSLVLSLAKTMHTCSQVVFLRYFLSCWLGGLISWLLAIWCSFQIRHNLNKENSHSIKSQFCRCCCFRSVKN